MVGGEANNPASEEHCKGQDRQITTRREEWVKRGDYVQKGGLSRGPAAKVV